MKKYNSNYLINEPVMVEPMMEINGFYVRLGMFDLNGATEMPTGVNFTVHSSRGTSCELLLFHLEEEEPYAVIFPS